MKFVSLLGKVMTRFCEREGVEKDSVRFLYNGERIVDEQTPLGLDMKHGDTVTVEKEDLHSARIEHAK